MAETPHEPPPQPSDRSQFPPTLGPTGTPPTGTPIVTAPTESLSPELQVAAAELAQVGEDAGTPADVPKDMSVGDIATVKRFAKIRSFFAKHGHLLWWLHSAYAMTFGAFVMMYAAEGYDRARWMVVLLCAGWLVIVMFFRHFGQGRGQKDKVTDAKSKLRFYVMTTALKNLYQSMLFFLVPFYWKAATLDADNRFFLYLLGLLALLSTVDVVFDQVLMRYKAPASVVYLFILFACLNLVLPAIFPDTRTLITLLAAAALATLVFFTMHVPFKNLLRPAWFLALLASVGAAMFVAYAGRRGIPPVPMYISDGAVGPTLLPDGRLSMHVSALHESLIQEMHALTDVVTPGGRGDNLLHVWRHRGLEVQRGASEPAVDPPPGSVRLRSTLRSFHIPSDRTGPWSIDVVTEDDQLVGRVEFEVIK
ncbi:DUF5924 family protein [Nannocystis radixulma]|uniref:DUF5924 family protein n=1 Tax=Nannocystis radixulma TaxID=2995305 RepID=A0ABT5B943_9BACT|nr:DUF5924 family protein [Nannocystis radixulma]MDC0669968.1 DUF5924 family protein [Nannocystis radixulma]